MTFLLETLLAFLLVYKYAAILVITFIAAFFFPLPASTTIVAASAFAFQGYLDFLSVLGMALVGNVLGDNLGYFISKKYGVEVVRAIGFRKLLDSPKFDTLKEYAVSNSRPLIFFSRFMTEVGPSVNVLSGFAGVPYKTYIVYELLGETSYVLLYGLVGYYLGSRWEYSVNFFTTAGVFMTSLGLLFFLIQAKFYRQNRRAGRMGKNHRIS